MNHHDEKGDGARPQNETILQRWSRRKIESRSTLDTTATPTPAAVDPGPAPPAAGTTPVELPDIDQLDEHSDYSAFLAPGVDAALRGKALNKLFHSPKFNIFDGLDTYRDDFTSFPALGSVVTADMRHHLERAAQSAVDRFGTESAAKPPDPASPTVTTSVSREPVATEPVAAASAPDQSESDTARPEGCDRADYPA